MGLTPENPFQMKNPLEFFRSSFRDERISPGSGLSSYPSTHWPLWHSRDLTGEAEEGGGPHAAGNDPGEANQNHPNRSFGHGTRGQTQKRLAYLHTGAVHRKQENHVVGVPFAWWGKMRRLRFWWSINCSKNLAKVSQVPPIETVVYTTTFAAAGGRFIRIRLGPNGVALGAWAASGVRRLDEAVSGDLELIVARSY